MQYRHYTKQSPLVSEIGFGAWQLGNNIDWSSPMSDKEAIALVHEALDLGVNFFDTAPGYGLGNSERLLGEALKIKDRRQVVISTKFGHHSDGHSDFSHTLIKSSVEGSLRRLNTDYLDSVLLHNPDQKCLDGNNNPHYEVLEQLKKEGKILAYGASLDSCEDMNLFMTTTKGDVIEALFNIFHQDARNAFALAKEKGVAIIAKIPLDSGWLTGKYNENSTFEGIRERWSPTDIKTRADLVEKIRHITTSGQSLGQAAIEYCLAYPAVSTVIPGNKNIDQLIANVKSIDYELSEDTTKWLEMFYENEVKPKNLPW